MFGRIGGLTDLTLLWPSGFLSRRPSGRLYLLEWYPASTHQKQINLQIFLFAVLGSYGMSIFCFAVSGSPGLSKMSTAGGRLPPPEAPPN